MLIRSGFQIVIQVATPTPMLCALSPHVDAPAAVFGSGEVHSRPETAVETHTDRFGNHMSRVIAPGGELTLLSDFIVDHSGDPDPVVRDARQHPVAELPAEALEFLMPSRYCESDLLAAEAWARFGSTPEGWDRVQAICDFVHSHIQFGYGFGRPTKTATDAFSECNGVCRDFAHLSIALCRAMNIPARYASGYLGDIGVPYGGPMDFCAWFEVYLGGAWYTFDARYNTPRVGRVLMVRGRDAADAAMITSFGPHVMTHFEVWSDEIPRDADILSLAAELRVPVSPAAERRIA